MGIENNAVFRTALQMCSKYASDPKKLRPMHVLYGYAKLMCMDEKVLQLMLPDSGSLQDLEGGRRILQEKHVDINLCKVGMPYLFSGLPEEEGQVKQILDRQRDGSTAEILRELFPGEDPLLAVFAEGHTLDDVLAYKQELTAKQEAAKPAETTEQGEAAEPEQVNPSEAAEEIKKAAESQAEPAGAIPPKKGPEPVEAPQPVPEDPKSFEELSEKYRKLRVDLLDVVKGQNDAVFRLVQGCFQSDVLAGKKARVCPKATFLLMGPAGVGKTLMAETAAKSLGYPTRTFRMGEYVTQEACEQLFKDGSSYFNTGNGDSLPGFIRKNPKCVLIFDDLENAAMGAIFAILQMLAPSKEEASDPKQGLSLKDVIVIFTSRIGRSVYEGNYGNITATPQYMLAEAIRAEKNPNNDQQPLFPEMICAMLDSCEMIMLNHLGVQELTQMVTGEFEQMAEQIQESYGFRTSFDPRMPLLCLFHAGGELNAKSALSQSGDFIKRELYELSRQLESHRDLLSGIRELRFELDLDSTNDEDVHRLFTKPQLTEIAVVCAPEYRDRFRMPAGYQVIFASSAEELQVNMDRGLSMVLIDLSYGLTDDKARGISMDDADSIGVQAFRAAEQHGENVPVYLLEAAQRLNETDRNIFIQRGADGIVTIIGDSAESVSRQLQQLTEAIYMDKQGNDFARRGYMLQYNTAQITEEHAIAIQYHSLKKSQVVDLESANTFVAEAERPTVRFDDVIGAENAKEELKYFIRYLSNPRKFIQNGGKPAKGVLLYGPPGTGKTMLARAMAGESNVAFIQTSATEFLNKYVGQSEENVRNLFKRAKKYAPAIIFIDEIDAIGKTRTGEAQYRESVLNALLTELDGFRTDINNPVFVLAATNYSVESDGSGRMTLDPALVRRFDNRICVDLPNEKERLQYLTLSVNKKGFVDADEATLKNIASRTPGLSIAILQNVVDLAFRNAQKEGRLPNGNDLQNALEEYNFGEKHEWSESYYRSVAIHESGHAYVAYLSGEKPSYMTIESRGNFGGYMAHESGEQKPNYSREELIWRIRTALGGRAAEEVFFGKAASLNTGASSDLQSATGTALHIICELGMEENQLIAMPFKTIAGTALAGTYLEQANALLIREMANTVKLIETGRDAVQRLADRLVQNNHLTGDEILEVLKN